MTIDLTPSAIAARLLPENFGAADRAIVEAMAERAIAVVHECGTEVRTRYQIERAMISAARAVIAQHHVRVERLLEFLAEPDEFDEAESIVDSDAGGES